MSQPLVFWMARVWITVLSSPDPVPLDPAVARALDRAIDDRAEDAFGFLERLVAAPSPVGLEMGAQQVIRDELDRLRRLTSVLPIPPEIPASPEPSLPPDTYACHRHEIVHNAGSTWISLLL